MYYPMTASNIFNNGDSEPLPKGIVSRITFAFWVKNSELSRDNTKSVSIFVIQGQAQ
jgi:hypothetical protein